MAVAKSRATIVSTTLPITRSYTAATSICLHIDSRGMTWKQWNNPADKSWCLEEKAQRFDYTQPPWSTKYPRLAAIMNENPREPLGNTIRRNVFVNCTKQVCSFDSNVKKLLNKFEIADNVVFNATRAVKGTEVKGFTNLSGTENKPIDIGVGNLTTRDTISRSQAWIQTRVPSFRTIPMEKIGLYKDDYRRTLAARP